jgi:pimeloyl-ACP methyl ester carboxylesterase
VLEANPVTDALVSVDTATLHVQCAGTGSPTVVFEAGLGSDGASWQKVFPEVARVTRACVYDRAGLGKSSAATRPRTSNDMVRELGTLLERARLPAPYVLVGHSLGGLNVRLFASKHPDVVAGVVLVDSTTEEQDVRSWALLPPEELAKFQAALQASPEGMTYDAFRESMALLRAARRSLGDRPLVVLTHGREDPHDLGGSPDVVARRASVWAELQAELPRWSTNHAHIIATNSRHAIPWEAPRLVAASVVEVVAAVRESRAVRPEGLVPLAGDGPLGE